MVVHPTDGDNNPHAPYAQAPPPPHRNGDRDQKKNPSDRPGRPDPISVWFDDRAREGRVVQNDQVYNVSRQQQQQNGASSNTLKSTFDYPSKPDPPAPNVLHGRMAPSVIPRQRRVHPEIVDLSNTDSPAGIDEFTVAQESVATVPNPLMDNGQNHRAHPSILEAIHQQQTQAQLHQQILALRERQRRQELQARNHVLARQREQALQWQQRQIAARHQQNQALRLQRSQQQQYQQHLQQHLQQGQHNFQESQPHRIQQHQSRQQQYVPRDAAVRRNETPVDYYIVTQHTPLVNPRHQLPYSPTDVLHPSRRYGMRLHFCGAIENEQT